MNLNDVNVPLLLFILQPHLPVLFAGGPGFGRGYGSSVPASRRRSGATTGPRRCTKRSGRWICTDQLDPVAYPLVI